MVCIRGGSQCDYLGVLLEKSRGRDPSATGSGAGYNLSSFELERHVRLGPVIPLWAEFIALF